MNMMQSVGQLLTETREKKGYSIKQISNTIKIRESLITALESGDYSSFTSDMHLKGFLRSYAGYLGINEDRILALYRRERQINSEDSLDKSINKESQSNIKIIISKFINIKTLLSLISLSVLILIIMFFYKQWQALTTPPTLEIKSPSISSTLTTETFVIEGFTGDVSVKVYVDGTEANYIDALGNFKVNAKFNEVGQKRFQIIAKNQFSKQSEKQLDLIYRPPEKQPEKPKIKINSKSSTTQSILIRKDNQTKFETIQIRQGNTLELTFDETIVIRNFDKNKFDLYISNSQSPTTGIDFKDITISIQNEIPIIREFKDEKDKPQTTVTVKP